MNQNFYGSEGIFKNFMAMRGEATISVALKELAHKNYFYRSLLVCFHIIQIAYVSPC